MEPVSLAVGLSIGFLSLSVFVDKTFRAAQVIQRGHGPRIDDIYIRLIVEKGRYADWRKRMGVNRPEDFDTLLTRLTPDVKESSNDIPKGHTSCSRDMNYGVAGHLLPPKRPCL